MKNTTKELTGGAEALRIPAVEETQTSTVLYRPLKHSGFDGTMDHKLLAGYKKPSMEIDEENHSWVYDWRRPLRFLK